ncbi:sugar phosphate nucleotidyltransferase [Patescibacteria group bacterium]|nr:sugar phosphate nucleotidyltransferase [Patescibacteria group bacterium]
MITKAVIAAAGRGTRFLPVTKAYPKELLPVWNRPAIQWIVEELVAAGLTEIMIVHRHGCPDIKNYFTPDKELDEFLEKVEKKEYLAEWYELIKKTNLSFKPQPRSLSYGTGAPILAAKNFIGESPFVYVYGDDLIAEKKLGGYLKSLIALHEQHHADAVVASQKVPWSQVGNFGIWELMENGNNFYQVKGVVEKPNRKEAPSNLANFGRMVLPSKVVKILTKQKLDKSGELFVTDTIDQLAKEGVVLTRPLEGKWVTIGRPEQWLSANDTFIQLFG